MKYLLDTNICIYLIKRKPETVVTRLESIPASSIALSSITFFEMSYRAAGKSQQPQRSLQTLIDFFSLYTSLPFDNQDALIAGHIRAELARQGRLIGPYDLQLAGQAKRHGLTLVTNNVAEFERIQDLNIENWV